MKLPRVRFTTRRMMVAILGISIVLPMVVAAWRIKHEVKRDHMHTSVTVSEYGPCYLTNMHYPTFWPAYWRRLTGFVWKGPMGCMGKTPGEMLEMCELRSPEIRKPFGPDTFAAEHTGEQIELFHRLRMRTRRPVR